ncbi:transposable element Tcb1 transposase [Trichonephila clavipes]|nr:transposable element Tcb1 transposase [Trichonephila clavipes]
MWVAEWNEVVFTDESRICLQHYDGQIRVWRHHGERMLNSCVMHRHTGPAPGIMVWGGIGYHYRTPLVRIAGTLNRKRYISEVLEPVVLPYLQRLATALFQQDNARPYVKRIVQKFFVNHWIELLPWPAFSPDISPIENMWPMVAQRLTQITPPAVTPDPLWKRVEAAWSAVPQEHIQSLFESITRHVAAVISNNGLLRRRAASLLVRLVVGDERWEAPDPPSGCSPSKLGWNRAKSYFHLYSAQGTANDMRASSPFPATNRIYLEDKDADHYHPEDPRDGGERERDDWKLSERLDVTSSLVNNMI